MQLSVDYMVNMINENQLIYITQNAVNNRDYNKLNMIITLATGFIPDYKDIDNLINKYNQDEKEYLEYMENKENEECIKENAYYVNRGYTNIF